MNINKIGINKIINIEEINKILKEISKSYTPDIISIVNKIIIILVILSILYVLEVNNDKNNKILNKIINI
jgi:hypothetical protein